ncbi:MAG TPA: hypothetical protein VGK46_07970 [Saprospiraceae bacterium]
MNGFFNPRAILLFGVIVVITGFLINHFFGLRGELLLVEGETKTLVTNNDSKSNQPKASLGMMITLDSMRVRAYTPEFEFLVMGPDTSLKAPGSFQMSEQWIEKFPAEQMKIRRVGDTDFYFRMKAFYPNFQFAYEYPVNRDTIESIAPGITLELKTKEGSPIVTLRSDQPNKHTLGDIVSLGATLFYFKVSALDSINALKDQKHHSKDMVVFSGEEQKVFFFYHDTLIEQPLKEGTFYKMPGHDTIGFTILYSFPDHAYLKAVPSTKDTAMLNPVAHVEVWKSGEGYIDAFLYPERRGRKGGEYAIPETGFKLGLGEVKEKVLTHCDCHLSIQEDSGKSAQPLDLLSGKSGRFKVYRFTPITCINQGTGTAKIEIVKRPGRFQIVAGIILIILTFSYMVINRNQRVS